MVKRLVAIAVAVVLLALGIVLARAVMSSTDSRAFPSEVASGALPQAPDFDLPNLDGSGTTSLAALRGQVVVLNFWASWCGPCRKELPAIAAFAKAHPEIAVIGVDYQDDVESAKAFAAEHGATWPSVVDDGPIGAAYKVPGLPATYLIDAQGQIVDRILGEVTEATLEAQVPELTG